MATLTAEFDASVYRLDAIKKALYRLGSRCTAEIEAGEGGRVRVRLFPKPDVDTSSLLSALREEVLDQELREVVRHETEAIRNLIIVEAFSRTSLLQDEPATTKSER